MSRKSKISFPYSPFVDLWDLRNGLDMLEAGCNYLASLINDGNRDELPFSGAIYNYRENASERFAALHELLDSDAAILNPKHPAFAEMYNAVCRIDKEARLRHEGELPKNHAKRAKAAA